MTRWAHLQFVPLLERKLLCVIGGILIDFFKNCRLHIVREFMPHFSVECRFTPPAQFRNLIIAQFGIINCVSYVFVCQLHPSFCNDGCTIIATVIVSSWNLNLMV